MISVTYVFETDDKGKKDEISCTAFIEEHERNVSKEEREACMYFIDVVKTSCSYEEGMEIRERSGG